MVLWRPRPACFQPQSHRCGRTWASTPFDIFHRFPIAEGSWVLTGPTPPSSTRSSLAAVSPLLGRKGPARRCRALRGAVVAAAVVAYDLTLTQRMRLIRRHAQGAPQRRRIAWQAASTRSSAAPSPTDQSSQYTSPRHRTASSTASPLIATHPVTAGMLPPPPAPPPITRTAPRGPAHTASTPHSSRWRLRGPCPRIASAPV